MKEHAESLLEQMLEEQRKTNSLLEQLIQSNLMLIEAMAEEGADPDAAPATYLDGSPVR
ncbi:hypothetical protein D3C76_135080 [compost metagenome]